MVSKLLHPRTIKLASVLLAVGFLVFTAPHTFAAWTAAQLALKIPNAEATIVSVESSAQANNVHCAANRTCLNTSGTPYWESQWISPSGSPSAGSALTLPASTTSVPLQLNAVFFLTAATTGKNSGSTTGLGTVDYTSTNPPPKGVTYAPNMVTTANYPDERDPAASPAVNVASIKASQYKIYSATVAGGGTLSNVPVDSIFGTVTDPSSRFAFSPAIPFTYNSGQWVGSSRTVTVTFTVAGINTFHSAPPTGTSQCAIKGVITTVASTAFDRCDKSTISYQFTFTVTPILNYILKPTVTASTPAAEPGESFTVTPKVANSGTTNTNSSTQWQLSQFIVPPNGTYPGAGNSSDDPATYYGHGLTEVSSATGVSFPALETTTLNYPTPFVIPNGTPYGSKVCVALSVQARANDDTDWAHSEPACVLVGKLPKAQILGGDLLVGQGFSYNGSSNTIPAAGVQASTSVKGTQTFGSWVEYGIFATGSISTPGVASAAAYNGGLNNASNCQENLLSFSLDPSSFSCNISSTFGDFSSAKSIPDIASSFPASGSESEIANGATFNPATSSLPSGVITAAGNFSITGVGGSIPAGKWYVINAPSANVTITGNINYTSGQLTSIDQIPQLVIIGNNITIDSGVTNVDAWLVAKGPAQASGNGVLTTCDTAPPLTVTDCANELTVNGPVMAQTLIMLRTAGSGSGTASGDPAEVFNLRPDAYLWEYAQASEDGHAQTVFSQELAPRL